MALITSQPKNPIFHNHFTTLHCSIPQFNRTILNFGPFSKNAKNIKVCNFNSKSRNFHLKNNPFNYNPQILAKSNAAIEEATLEQPEEDVPLKYRKILLSDVEVKREREILFGRKWNSLDIGTFVIVLSMHLLCLFAPFNFNWPAFWVAVALYVITGLFGITLSFHRNLSHRSFKLPKWLEYFCAYCGVLALQVQFLFLQSFIFCISLFWHSILCLLLELVGDY
jgi:stearoyl-CoA desaturase (delta-9 desaturase)